MAPSQLLVQRARLRDHPLVFRDQRQHGRLHRRDLGVQAQHGALTFRHDLLVVGIDEEREQRAVGAAGRLDHVGHIALAGRAVDELELRA